jgi:hypothetical protein
MPVQAIFTTILGAFLFPFLIRMMWGKFVKIGGVIGGFFVASVLIGTIWIMNHGMENHLIKQSGTVWIDMAWSAAIGIFIASFIGGGKIKKSFTNISAAVVGGIIGGIVLVFIK